ASCSRGALPHLYSLIAFADDLLDRGRESRKGCSLCAVPVVVVCPSSEFLSFHRIVKQVADYLVATMSVIGSQKAGLGDEAFGGHDRFGRGGMRDEEGLCSGEAIVCSGCNVSDDEVGNVELPAERRSVDQVDVLGGVVGIVEQIPDLFVCFREVGVQDPGSRMGPVDHTEPTVRQQL